MRKEVHFRLVGIVAAGVAALGLTASAEAKTFNVHPGKNAIQKAVNHAGNGDRIRVHDGNYREDILVDKRLRITDAGDGRPTINGQCLTQGAINVVHGGVVLRGLRVTGAADFYAINMTGVPSGTIKDVVMRETCLGGDAALYGINVFQAGALNLINNDGRGYTDAGIYVGQIDDTGAEPLRIEGNSMTGNNIGILVEYGDGGRDITVRNNVASGNTLEGAFTTTGILLRGEDDVLVEGNTVNDNGTYGIHLDGDSADNVVNNNTAGNNGDSPPDDFFDQGTNNCGAGNSFSIDPCTM